MSEEQNKLSRREWDMVLKPDPGWFNLHLAEVWRYRDLVKMFVHREFVSKYKQTVLGPLWYVIQPLLTSLIFTIIFNRVARISTDGVPPFLFYLAGNVTWMYFAKSLTDTSNTFVMNASIFGKVYFPRLTVPLAIVVANFIQFLIQFLIFMGFYAYSLWQGFSPDVNWLILLLPVILLQMAVLSLGMGILISSLVTKYRDLTMLMAFAVQLWMYATPVVYPLSLVPDKYRLAYMLNPMASVVEVFRMGFLGAGNVTVFEFFLSWAVTLAILFVGLLLFNRIEKSFMDTV